MSTKNVLVIMHTGFEEMEAIVPIDLMRRAGLEVTVASADEKLELVGRDNIKIICDCPLSSVVKKSFDCVMIPGGPGVMPLRKNKTVQDIIIAQNAAKKIVAAICAAPLILKDAGIITGKKVTGYTSIKEEIPDLIEDKAVVIDGNIITSRGPATAFAFGFAIIEMLLGKDKVNAIKEETHFM